MKRAGYSTVDKILDNLLKTLSEPFKEKVKTMTCDEFIAKQHFNLGTIIKEKYFYKNSMRDALVKSLGEKKEHRFLDGDVVSGIVLKALWKKINQENKT
jgi:Domain of unknown function (DUF6794)